MESNKITLHEKEILMINSVLGNEYELCSPEGLHGAHSITLPIRKTNGQMYVFKKPLDENPAWIEFQIAQHNNVSKVFLSAQHESGVNYEVIESYGEQHYIAKYLGEPLGLHITTMDANMRRKTASRLARFLFSIHQNKCDQIKPFKSFEYPSLSAICNFLSQGLSQEERSLINEISDRVESLRNVSFSAAFIHGDFRSDNILYDKATDTLSIIDFECAGYSNILREFALDAMSSLGLPYEFWYMVVDEYCHMGKTVVTTDIVRLLMAASLIHEYGRCAIAARSVELDLLKRCQYMRENLKLMFEKFG